MKVNISVQPPSLRAQLEGKSGEALAKKIKETNEKIQAVKKENVLAAEVPDTQSLIDLLA